MELHDLPQAWAWTTIGEIATVIRGASPRPKGDPKYFGGTIPWIMISDVTRAKGKYLYETKDTVTEEGATLSRYLPSGTLILSNSGTVCVPKILAVNGCIHDGFVAITELSEGIYQDFLYHYFDYIRPDIIRENKQGVTQVNLNTQIVKDIPLSLPPLPEQERIVEAIEAQLSRIEAGVASVRNAHRTLRRYKASVLNAAFQGNLLSSKNENMSANELIEQIKAYRTNVLFVENKSKDKAEPYSEGLYKLPKGWVWTTLEFLTEQIADIDHKMPKAVEQGVPFLSAKDLKDNGSLDFSEPKYISEDDFTRLSRKLLPTRNDIVYSRIGARLGKARLVEVDTRFLISYSCCLVRPIHEFIDKKYLQLFLDSHLALNQGLKEAKSIGVPDLGLGAIKQFQIPLPPLAEQARIVEEVERRLSVVAALEQTMTATLQRAARLRQSVLRKAFRGELVGRELMLP